MDETKATTKAPAKAGAKRKPTVIADDSKPTVRLRRNFVTDSFLAGGDGTTVEQSFLDPYEVMGAMDALAIRLGVEPRNWMQIAVKLAIVGGHVLIEKETGQVERWNEALYAALWLDVRIWCEDHSVAVKPCIQSTEFLQAWMDRAGEGDTPSNLRRKFYEASKESAMVRAFALFEERDVPLPWGELRAVADFMHTEACRLRAEESAMRRFAKVLQPQE